MRPVIPLFFLTLTTLSAQTELGLQAFYPFQSNLGDAAGNPNNLGVPEGVVDFDCAIDGEGLLLTSPGDFVRIPGGGSENVNRVFRDEDFTVSLYFKPSGSTDNQILLAKRDTNCTSGQYFEIRYAGRTRALAVILRQDLVAATLTYQITNRSCWQQVTVTREDTRVRLYVNGEEVGSTSTSNPVNVDNDGDLLIGATTCPDPLDRSFAGLIDELRIYNRALPPDEVRELYASPDRILTADTPIFLGESIDVNTNISCNPRIRWAPAADVTEPDEAEPTIRPSAAGRQTYILRVTDGRSGCVAEDELILTVIDPDSLDCSQIFLPKAFTPNGIGPEANETFGIANPFAVSDLEVFEIFDRYGARVYRTSNPFRRWDGTYGGEPVQPSVLLWRIVYTCEGQQVVRTGPVTLLR
jgi:gliding motility-associated-like protein